MEIIEWVLHLDKHLAWFADQLGPWFYGLLFAIIFGETGLVIAPFLPGDSLLFAVGALAASQPNSVSLAMLLPLLIVAAILGDALNYALGKWVGPQIFRRETGWLMNKNHLVRAQAFYEKYGAKAIVLARFLPILRTFAPFVAGIGGMQYRRFWLYNVIGAVAWVSLFLIGGYAFGTSPFVKDRFPLVILAIVGISVLPIAYEWFKSYRESKKPNA